jgi:hypothetical protein
LRQRAKRDAANDTDPDPAEEDDLPRGGELPSDLTGNVTFVINQKRGNPKRAGGRKQNYTVKLDDLVLHLSGVEGTGDNRKARYSLQSVKESFAGPESLTNSKCQTTHIVWAG